MSRVDASEKRMRRDGCFKLAAVRFNRMQLVFIHCCLLFEQSLAWNCRMRFLLFPVMTGTGQFRPISMGGMFTVLKVRDGISSFEDPGWYRHPDGTVATVASA
jgi:hypothetical protein